MSEVSYVQIDAGGHQPDFDRFFHAVLKRMGLSVRARKVECSSIFSKAPMFYSWLDRSPAQIFGMLAVAAFRSMIGRRTVGLFFRPNTCFYEGSVRAVAGRLLFGIVSRLPNVRILSIVPFGVYPLGEKVATGWIYDPQLWDLEYLDITETPSAAEDVERLLQHAKGRKIIVSLGRQDRSKGFDAFVDIWCASPEIRKSFLFVAAGKVCKNSLAAAARFVQDGGVLVNEHVDEAALFLLYRNAALVWSCYGPNYDQSSGIFGRAVQLGVPALVRKGSFIDTLSASIKHEALAIPFDAPADAAIMILGWTPLPVDKGASRAVVAEMEKHSLNVLAEALR
jgi:hypothetical protein